MPNFSEIIKEDSSVINVVKSAVKIHEPISDVEHSKENQKLLNQLDNNLYLGSSAKGFLVLLILCKSVKNIDLNDVGCAVVKIKKHFNEFVVPVFVSCENLIGNGVKSKVEDRFKFSIDEVNDIFEMLGENKSLREIEQSEENKKILEEIDGLCLGLDDSDRYVLVIGCYDRSDLDFGYIEDIVSKLQNHFNQQVVVNIFSGDIVDEYEKQLSGKINEDGRYENGNVSQSLIDSVNSLFEDLEIEDKLIEIERTSQNKEILDRIGKDFVTLTESGECLILDFADDEMEIDGIHYQELADDLEEHFKVPVKAIVLCPGCKDGEEGLFVSTINFFSTFED